MASLEELAGEQNEDAHYINKNVNWVGRRLLIFYTLVLFVGAYFTHTVLVGHVLSAHQGWTLVNVIHSLVNFVVMHYVTGVPADLDNDEFYQLTWWEQLDDGVPWTERKRNLMIIPVALFLVVAHNTEYEPAYFVLNLAALALVLVPKLPSFYRVRLTSSASLDEADDGAEHAHSS